MNAPSNRPKLFTRTNNYPSRLLNIPATSSTGLTRQNGSRFLIKPNYKKSLIRQNGSRNLTRNQRRKNYRKSRKLRR
jgi:hypothetical protein